MESAVDVDEDNKNNDNDDDDGPPPSTYHLYDGVNDVPSNVTHVRVGPAVTVIRQGAFLDRKQLASVTFSNDVAEGGASSSSSSPSSLREIERVAFEGCTSLSKLLLPDSVERILERAFWDCPLVAFRIPRAITVLVTNAFGSRDMDRLVSLEVPESVSRVTASSYTPYIFTRPQMTTLRNVAFPPGCVVEPGAMWGHASILAALFPNDGDRHEDDDELRREMSDALRGRFVGLPIHDICYHQSRRDVETVLRDLRRAINPWSCASGPMILGRLNEGGKRRDRLGMTPLHILACSTRHDMDIFRLLVSKYPENLVTEDGWGDIPLLYAFWCDAPDNVVRFLVESYRSRHPGYVFDWGGMVRTLAEGRASASVVRRLLDVHRRDFPDQECDLRDVVAGLAMSRDTPLFRRGPTASVGTLRFLLREVVSRRVDSSRVGRWRVELTNAVDEFPDSANDWEGRTRALYSRIDLCETLRESVALLELALWKARIGGGRGDGGRCRKKKRRIGEEEGAAGPRDRCRINCGADIVVRNVLPYLWPGMRDGF